MLMKAAKAVWLTGMKSSPVLTTESSDLRVALEVEVRKVVILSEGWKRGSSGSYVAAMMVKTSTPKTKREKPMFPIRLSAF